MAYSRMGHLMEALTPDVVVLQEVSKADIIGAQTPFAAWTGSNKQKGLGVLGMTPGQLHHDRASQRHPSVAPAVQCEWTEHHRLVGPQTDAGPAIRTDYASNR